MLISLFRDNLQKTEIYPHLDKIGVQVETAFELFVFYNAF